MKKIFRKIFLVLCILTISLCLFTACGDSGVISNTDKDAQKAFSKSTPENDTDMGLKNIKIDTAEHKLTEEQKAVLSFFDDDYLSVPDYEFLCRYPDVFENAEITFFGTVEKIISMNDESYEMLVLFDMGTVEYEYRSDFPEYDNHFVILTGKTGSTRFMEGDTLDVFGRYMSMETTSVDGTSYTVPKINVFNAILSDSNNQYYTYTQKFDYTTVNTVASAIFGNDIEIRNPIIGTDVSQFQWDMWHMEGVNEECSPCFVVELENQTNAKFSKYYFFTGVNYDAMANGRIVADDQQYLFDETMSAAPSINRYFEFSADFSHFFLFTYDTSLETLKLEYYDSELNKIWKREFTETTSALYDYTKNNIYVSINNELYIINTETGEDTFEPLYVGEKEAVRKLSNGILLISASKSDGAMLVNTEGDMLWKTNLSDDVLWVDGIQVVEDKIVFESTDTNGGTHYYVLNTENGNMIIDAIAMNNSEFH